MPVLQNVTIEAMDPLRFESVLSVGEFEALRDLIAHAAQDLHGQVIWNVNSTAKGGGVVEMLRPLLGYCRGAGVDARRRWAAACCYRDADGEESYGRQNALVQAASPRSQVSCRRRVVVS